MEKRRRKKRSKRNMKTCREKREKKLWIEKKYIQGFNNTAVCKLSENNNALVKNMY